MSTDLLATIEKQFIKKRPNFSVGDSIAVSTIVREGEKSRIQVFKGIVIAIKGSGARRTFTIRKISAGIGVEKILPLYSPNISKIELLKKGKVRRSKIYYMRDRIGKKALKVNEGVFRDEDYLIEDEAPVEAEIIEQTETADAKAATTEEVPAAEVSQDQEAKANK